MEVQSQGKRKANADVDAHDPEGKDNATSSSAIHPHLSATHFTSRYSQWTYLKLQL
jgi:hypothetical protein